MVPRRLPRSCCWTAPPGGVCRADPLLLAWSVLCCPAGHGSITGRTGAPCIHYYNKRLPCPVQRPVWRWYLVSVEALRLTVCPPAWHRWCIGGLCGCCIVCTGIGQINGNAAVKLRKRFWRFGRIICINGRRTAVNACKRLTRRLAKRKALHRVDARQKKNPATWAGLALVEENFSGIHAPSEILIRQVAAANSPHPIL